MGLAPRAWCHPPMRLPPAVHVTLAPSRQAVAFLVALALVTCGVLATLPFDPALLALAMLAILVWAGDRIYVVGLRRGDRMGPGTTALTRRFARFSHSSASSRASAAMAALVTA